MSPSSKLPAPPFTPAERAWLRQELGVHFGAPPHIADGIFLRSWKSGSEKGRPKLPPAAQSMLARGLIEIRPARIGHTAFLTDSGLAALRLLATLHHTGTQIGGTSSVELSNGRRISKDDLESLSTVHEYLRDHFSRHLTLLRNRPGRN